MPSNAQNSEFPPIEVENRRLREEVSQLKLDVRELEAMLNYLRKARFAPSSERHINQPMLIPDGLAEVGSAEQESDNVTEISGHKRRKKKRPTIPDNLPREVVHHDLPESERVCPHHGTPLERSGETKTTQVEYLPAKIKVIDHLCATYDCPVCDKTVKTARSPAAIIPGSIATPSLLAQIATAKFADGLPLYRQENILARAGLELTRTTMATWMGRLGTLLAPLCNLFNDTLMVSPVIFMDETHLQVLNVPGKPATSKSYLWVRVGGLDGEKVVLFHFDPSRSSNVPLALLAGYKGFVTTDDYIGYQRMEGLEGIRRTQCWMHVRRYFKKAFKALSTAGRGGIADQALGKIRILYRIERECADLSADERYRIRLAKTKPLLDDFHPWLQAALNDLPPKGGTARGIRYTLDNWDQLLVFLEDGRLKPDNSPAENAIRPVAVGRKNWLFSSSVEGAEATATLYSVVETAKAHGLDPFRYLRHVIEALLHFETLSDLEALLPWNVGQTMAP